MESAIPSAGSILNVRTLGEKRSRGKRSTVRRSTRSAPPSVHSSSMINRISIGLVGDNRPRLRTSNLSLSEVPGVLDALCSPTDITRFRLQQSSQTDTTCCKPGECRIAAQKKICWMIYQSLSHGTAKSTKKVLARGARLW